MKLLCVFLAGLLVALCHAEDDEVKIDVVEAPPADCDRKSKKFDQLSMHYTGTLTETGVKFDSRYVFLNNLRIKATQC